MAQFIYTMIGVSKIVPPNRTIIKDISLSFFPGAKIGVQKYQLSRQQTVRVVRCNVNFTSSPVASLSPAHYNPLLALRQWNVF